MIPHGEIPEFRQRYRYLVALVGVSFAILVGRLWQLQIIDGDHYRRQTEDNFVQETRIPTVRGLILDRKGRSLVANRPSYDVYVTPRFATEASLDRLIQELSLNPDAAELLKRRVLQVRGVARFNPRLAVRDISRDQLARIETNRTALAGVSVEAVAHRSYAHGNLAAHVVGYMNEVSPPELKKDRGKTYRPGDLVGRFGVERMYENHLRGVPGRERIVVDAKGIRKGSDVAVDLLKGERRVEPQPGHNIVLTIDVELQRLVERALNQFPAGAAVVLEAQTGRVLASASRPAFEPNLLTGRLTPEEGRRLINDPHRPLIDKVVQENYFPGSTYKVIPAIAGVEEKLITWDDTVLCKGWHSFGRRSFRCAHVHKKVDLHEAIARSCNVYFYTLAEQVGMDALARYARLFGLGAATGLGLNDEVAGHIPSKAWYAAQKIPFRLGFTLNAGIGQGNTKVTPIQIATLYAAIANGGTLYLPQIVERIEDGKGLVVQSFAPRVRRVVPVAAATLSRVRAALRGVVEDPEGTARESRLEEVAVAGKTGTAQVTRRSNQGKTIWLADHSWFAAFAPAEKPEIALAVLIEHGGKAAKVAAPVAMEIIRGYFKYVAPRGAARGPQASLPAPESAP
ncbi:MAG: penicillin-binding protein 2 [Deltaproteobacteria bacterium]|nr:penicillin-binding protein 2 [Deltaproteobacteria bacterium]